MRIRESAVVTEIRILNVVEWVSAEGFRLSYRVGGVCLSLWSEVILVAGSDWGSQLLGSRKVCDSEIISIK